MPYYVAFHLGLHYLLKYPFSGFRQQRQQQNLEKFHLLQFFGGALGVKASKINGFFIEISILQLIYALCALLCQHDMPTFENGVDSDQLASLEAS